MMSILREIPVYWRCLNCGREGVYTTWDMDADPTSIDKLVQRRREIAECPYCTDGVEGPLPDFAGMKLEDILKAVIEELKKLAKAYQEHDALIKEILTIQRRREN